MTEPSPDSGTDPRQRLSHLEAAPASASPAPHPELSLLETDLLLGFDLGASPSGDALPAAPLRSTARPLAGVAAPAWGPGRAGVAALGSETGTPACLGGRGRSAAATPESHAHGRKHALSSKEGVAAEGKGKTPGLRTGICGPEGPNGVKGEVWCGNAGRGGGCPGGGRLTCEGRGGAVSGDDGVRGAALAVAVRGVDAGEPVPTSFPRWNPTAVQWLPAVSVPEGIEHEKCNPIA